MKRILMLVTLFLVVACEEDPPFQPKYDQTLAVTEEGKILKLQYYMGGDGTYVECYTVVEVDTTVISAISRLQEIHQGARYLNE